MAKTTLSKNTLSSIARRSPSFSDIRPGDILLSFEDDIDDGFWPALVQTIKNDVVTLKWQKRLDRRPFKKAIRDLGLLWAGQDIETENPPTPSGERAVSWSDLQVGRVALTCEDGPMSQFWLSRIVEQTAEDRFSIQWMGYPDVPPVERTRHSIGLLHPSGAQSIKLRQPKQKSK